MVSYRIKLLNAAYWDLQSIGDYITYTLLEPGTSKRFIKALRTTLSNLSTFPYRYPTIDQDNNYMQIRCMPFKNYNLFYFIDEANKTVFVNRIIYNKRNWVHILRL